MMIALIGDLVRSDGVQETTILIENGIIKRIEDGIDTSAASRVMEGTIYPGLMDMHTHLGDHSARGPLPPDLKEVVFPGGMKHRFLDTSSRENRVLSIERSLEELKPGVTRVFDYREGGLEGIEVLKEALFPGSPDVSILARPGENEDIDLILDGSEGFGMPSLDSCTDDLREAARKKKKIFSLHASELYREPVDRILDLGPDQLVHMISASDQDLEAISTEKIPVTICPRSNLTYSLPMRLPDMHKAGIPLTLGTDNAISTRQDIFREMELAWFLLRRTGMEGCEASREVFSMATGETLKETNLLRLMHPSRKWWDDGWPSRGDPAHLFVVRGRAGRYPISDLVRFKGQGDVLFTGPRE